MRLAAFRFQVPTVIGLLISACVLGAQERPVFRAGVEAVAVDVVVVDRDGRPVTDLTTEDLTLLVDGRPRPAVSLEYIPMTSDQTGAPATEQPLPFSTNIGAAPGRLVLFVVDRENIRAGEGKTAMQAAKRFLDRLPPNDRAGLFCLPTGVPRIDFTSDKGRIAGALDQIVGQGTETSWRYNIGLSEALAIRRSDRFVLAEVVERECSADPEPGCPDLVEMEARGIADEAHRRARQSLTSLQNLIQALKEIDSPKILVLISQGLVHDMDTMGNVVPVARTAAAARVTLYAVQIDSALADASRQRAAPTPMDDQSLLADGMGALAGMTRGALFRGGASYDSAMGRIGREIAGYYLLAFEPEEGDRDGKPHRIDVRCRRGAGSIVRSRSEFVIPTEEAAGSEADALTRVLRNPFPSAGLPIEATAYTLLDPDVDHEKVLIVAQIGDPLEPPPSVSLAWAVVDERGGGVAGQTERLVRAEERSSPLRFAKSIPIEPGNYTLKVAARDGSGRLGSVEHSFHVSRRSTEGLEASELVLIDATTRPGMPLTSVVTGSSVSAYVELGSEESKLPPDLVLTFDVSVPGDDEPLVRAKANLKKGSEPHRWVAEAEVPLGSLPPRNYVLRATVSKDGRPWFHVDRLFRWSPRTEVATTNVGDLRAGPPRDYAELLDRYRSGDFVRSARELSGWPRESVEAAVTYFETRALTDRERLSVALLHTEVILRGSEDDDYHLEVAEKTLEGIGDAPLRSATERQWYLLVGEFLRYLNRDGLAVQVLERARERFPDDMDMILLSGAVCEASAWMRKDERGSWLDGAERFYRRLLEADPDHAEAHLRLGHVFKLRKRLDDATGEIEDFLRRDPAPETKAVAHLLRGDIHRARQETSLAIEDYRAALTLEPDFRIAAAALSYGLFEEGEFDGSREVIERYYVVEAGPSFVRDPWWRYLRGRPEVWAATMTLMRKELQ